MAESRSEHVRTTTARRDTNPAHLSARIRRAETELASVKRLITTLSTSVNVLMDDEIRRVVADFTPEQMDDWREACKLALDAIAADIGTEVPA